MNPEDCIVGKCDRCNKDKITVVADGYFVGWLCEDYFKFVHAID
jgi:hypothetical protein